MFSLWLIYAFVCHYHVTAQCNNALSCIGDIGDVSTDSISGNGYKSLFQSPSSTTHFRKCNGALSCSHTPHIDTNYLECYGTSSCSNTGSMEANNYMEGDGSNALMNVMNVNISNGEAISCNGDKGCAHSTISSSSNSWILSAYGALSLFETTINVISTTFTAKLYGYYAGYHSTIYCKDGSICNIDCGHNGCGGLSLICDDSSQCTNIESKTNIISNEVLLWNSTAITTGNEEECSVQPTSRTFDDYFEHSDESDIDVGWICCRASNSCSFSNYSISSNISTAMTASVVCSAYYSCNEMHIISNNDNIPIMVECSGVHSCIQSVINTNGGNLYCLGYYGCYQTQITKVSNMYCSGARSCQLATISSSGKDITLHLTGYQSGGSSQVTCNENDRCTILCDAYLACLNMDLYCYGTCIVECNQDTRCPNGWTSNPTLEPTVNPTSNPTVHPTINPTINPTSNPTVNPTVNPTSNPIESNVTDGSTKTITIIGLLVTVFIVAAIW